jgi:hypothetical protein
MLISDVLHDATTQPFDQPHKRMVLAVPSQTYFVKITGINVNLRRKRISLYQLNAWYNLILRRWNSDL